MLRNFRFIGIATYAMLFLISPRPGGAVDLEATAARPHGNYGELLLKVAIFQGKIDKRRKLTAAEERRYSATGNLECAYYVDKNGMTVGAMNLRVEAICRNIIVTSGHAFFSASSCAPVRDLSHCKMIFDADPDKEYLLDKIDASGYTDQANIVDSDLLNLSDPRYICRSRVDKVTDDWEVLELTKPLSKVIHPYRVSRYFDGVRSNPDNVISVGKGVDYLTKTVTTNPKTRIMIETTRHPLFIESCHIEDYHKTSDDRFYLGSDCADSPGTSGSGLFISNSSVGDPELIAIASGNTDQESDRREEKQSGVPMFRPYTTGVFASYYTPVTGSFLDTLLKLKCQP
jgi:hypothetical protein